MLDTKGCKNILSFYQSLYFTSTYNSISFFTTDPMALNYDVKNQIPELPNRSEIKLVRITFFTNDELTPINRALARDEERAAHNMSTSVIDNEVITRDFN